MLRYRLRLFILCLLGLIVNGVVLLWTQPSSTLTAHAQAQPVNAAQVGAVTPTTFSYQISLTNAA